jgi:hypothetical protein
MPNDDFPDKKLDDVAYVNEDTEWSDGSEDLDESDIDEEEDNEWTEEDEDEWNENLPDDEDWEE